MNVQCNNVCERYLPRNGVSKGITILAAEALNSH